MSSVVPMELPLGLLNALAPQSRNTANLACRVWPPPPAESATLFVGGDSAEAYTLDPVSLTTGPTLGKVAGFEALAGKKLLAHSRFDAARNRLVFAALEYKAEPGQEGTSELEFWEYHADGALVSHITHSSPFIVVHDWTITPDFIVVPINPAKFEWGRISPFVLGLAPAVSLFELDMDAASGFLLLPRDGGEPMELRAEGAGAFFNIFHLGPVHAGDAEGELVLHACITDRYSFGREMGFDARAQEFDPIGWSAKGGANPPPRLERFVLHVPSQQVVSRQTLPLATSAGGEGTPVDMPTFHPLRDGERARYCYFAGAPRPEGWFPFCTVVKADLQTGAALQWDPGEECVVSEPMLLPRDDGGVVWRGEAAEDEGWLVCLVHDARAGRSSLAVFDAAAFDEGPIAQLDLGPLCAWGVHGHWRPATAQGA